MTRKGEVGCVLGILVFGSALLIFGTYLWNNHHLLPSSPGRGGRSRVWEVLFMAAGAAIATHAIRWLWRLRQ